MGLILESAITANTPKSSPRMAHGERRLPSLSGLLAAIAATSVYRMGGTGWLRGCGRYNCAPYMFHWPIATWPAWNFNIAGLLPGLAGSDLLDRLLWQCDCGGCWLVRGAGDLVHVREAVPGAQAVPPLRWDGVPATGTSERESLGPHRADLPSREKNRARTPWH